MSRVRYEIEGSLELLSPLHIGSGEERIVATVKGKDKANRPPAVAAIVRDAEGKPYLPPTAIKGLLRRIGECAFAGIERRVTDLFGDLDARRAGIVLVRGASLKSAPSIPAMPYVEGAPERLSDGGLGRGVFVAARTAMNHEKGVALDHTLHHAEMVAPGALFDLRLVIETRSADAESRAEEALHHVIGILDHLTESAGHGIGRGTADGFGRIRLDKGNVRIGKRTISKDGGFPIKDASQVWRDRVRTGRSRPEPETMLTLVADGPFLIADSSRKPRERQVADKRRPQLAAQRMADDVPLVLGSSVSGALRSRARWLAMLSGEDNPEEARAIADLSPLQRLFGSTGFKGLLTIDIRCLNRPQLWTAASVKIDRFSGGPIQNALFHTQAFVGTRLALTLRLEERTGIGRLMAADKTLFEALIADVRDNGLMLGHGTNKGYGWFRTEAA